MKNLNKKWIIGISVISVLVVVLVIAIILGNSNSKTKEFENENDNQTITNEYTAYISINPKIKLAFKEVCTKENDDSNSYFCDNPTITNYELLNDDAKDIYNDVDFLATGGDLGIVLEKIAQRAREEGIVFDTVNIKTDWDNFKEYHSDNKTIFSEWKFEITIVNKEDLDKQEVEKFTVTFGSDGGSSVSNQVIKSGELVTKPKNPTKDGYIFIEWQLDGKSYDFSTPVNKNIELKAKWKKKSTPSDNSNNNIENKDETTNSDNLNNNTENKDEIKYTVSFNSKGGSVVPNQIVVSGGKATKPKDPTKPGFTFVEWQIKDMPYRAYTFEGTIRSNIELVAVWKLDGCDYNLNDNIFYTIQYIRIIEEPNTECINLFKKYDFEVNLESDDLFSKHIGEIPYDNIEVSDEERSIAYKETEHCIIDVSQSKLEKLKHEKGIKVFGPNNSDWGYTYIYFLHFPDINLKINASKYGIVSYGVGATVTELESYLLTEDVCKEYNLSCGRW